MQAVQIKTIMPLETPSPIPLTHQAAQILNALREVNDWLNRRELAKRAGKSALNKWDLVLLGKLVDAGLIETRQITRHGPIGYEWQYRAVQPGEDKAKP